ncbi:hypothetical protein D3C78_1382540 [compost metagenome]
MDIIRQQFVSQKSFCNIPVIVNFQPYILYVGRPGGINFNDSRFLCRLHYVYFRHIFRKLQGIGAKHTFLLNRL